MTAMIVKNFVVNSRIPRKLWALKDFSIIRDLRMGTKHRMLRMVRIARIAMILRVLRMLREKRSQRKAKMLCFLRMPKKGKMQRTASVLGCRRKRKARIDWSHWQHQSAPAEVSMRRKVLHYTKGRHLKSQVSEIFSLALPCTPGCDCTTNTQPYGPP